MNPRSDSGAAVAALVDQIMAEVAVTRHHGRPGLPARAKVRWSREIVRHVPRAELVGATRILCTHANATVRQVGLRVLADPAVSPAIAEDQAALLADDPDWEVREWVVEPLVQHAARGQRDWLWRWAAAGGGRRRAAVVGARALLIAGSITCAEALDVARQGIDDPNPYVAASVGTFLLADGVVPRCPDAFLAWAVALACAPAPSESPRWRHLAASARRDRMVARQLERLIGDSPVAERPEGIWLVRRLSEDTRRRPQVNGQPEAGGNE